MKRMLVIIVVALVFLSGCVSDESTEEVQTSSYTGIVTSAYAGSLPSSVYEGESIPMQFLVENQGDYDINAGAYFLKIKGINPGVFAGLEPSDLEKSSTDKMSALSSFGEETIVSGQEVVTISNNACYNNDIENDLTLNFHAKSCYKYGTVSSASACFVEISGTGDGICSPSEFKAVTNTIAPVVVTELAQSPAGETDAGHAKYRFRVKVQNMGSGTVFNKGIAVNKCDNFSPSDKNIVYIDSIKLDGQELDSTTLTYEGGIEEDKYTIPYISGKNSLGLPRFSTKTVELARFSLGPSTDAGRFSFIIEQESDIEFEGDLDIELSYAYTQTDVFSTTINALPDQTPNCT